VIVVEETCAGSGLGDALCALLQEHRVSVMDLGRWFPTHGSLTQLYRHYGLDADAIAQRVREVLSNGK
jgi:transketolase C-terminal domain/subunit